MRAVRDTGRDRRALRRTAWLAGAEEPLLSAPTVAELTQAVDGGGGKRDVALREREVMGVAAGMTADHVLDG